jgi:beta-N-acetylhexosaminidase
MTACGVGELFILGFFGKVVPAWIRKFAARYGLGGIILFDYSCQTRRYDNNIESPEQPALLCEAIACLPCNPLVFIDQEAEMADIADGVERGLQKGTLAQGAIADSIGRARQRKALLA